MNDYRVTIKVRNNRILTAIAKAGGDPGGKWCDANGLSYCTVNNLINMTASPLLASGRLSQTAERLCDVLNSTPEDLWSNEQLYPLEKNFSELEMSHDQVMALVDSPVDFDMAAIENGEMKRDIALALSVLPERWREVVRMRIMEEMTADEVGEALGITGARVRQIEVRALRSLRAPRLGGLMVGHLKDDSFWNRENYKKAGATTRMRIARGDI